MNITEHRHFGIRLIAAIVALSAVLNMSVGLVGMILLAAAYLLSTIAAFGIRHDYPWVGHPDHVVCGCTVLGGLGLFVCALIGLGKSALEAMSQHSALGLAKTAAGDPALKISDTICALDGRCPSCKLRSSPSRERGSPVESAESSRCLARVPCFCNGELAALSRQSVHDLLTTRLELLALLLGRFGLSGELRVLARPVVPESAGRSPRGEGR
ncbi:hypothetical protein [Bradyrhizobium sp. RT4b]|uniref:hypothetical protein n=1 Tax=Bradyrhizobium sp. RT4b TaxID=3156379 RepID=UPI003393AA46